ncbi:hypothetical protein [Kitasatospora sp. NBC_01539]|uniref:hypothetical protein n=1 Tax=Kitasatospora sp. NBC_01539 TaxID=2903577 RepID=UPI0038600CC4
MEQVDEDTRPLLLLDVDGPLAPYRADPRSRPEGCVEHRAEPEVPTARRPAVLPADGEPPRLWLNPAHGPALLALPFRLVWCTAREGEANTWIGPAIGLPPLPFVPWPRRHHGDPDGLHWKTRHLTAYAAGRPFAWVDDEIEPVDTAWIAAHHPAPALALAVDHRHGLQPEHVAVLADWAARAPAPR